MKGNPSSLQAQGRWRSMVAQHSIGKHDRMANKKLLLVAK
jgi:hypothetical protein